MESRLCPTVRFRLWLLRNVCEKPKPIGKGAEEPPGNNSSYATSESEPYLKMPGKCEDGLTGTACGDQKCLLEETN